MIALAGGVGDEVQGMGNRLRPMGKKGKVR